MHTLATLTGLKVKYNKSILPFNVDGERMGILAGTLNCQIGSMPFTYLGLLLGIKRPGVADCLPLTHRIERRLVGCSQFLTQGGKLEMVNFVLSSLPTFNLSIIKVPATVIHQLDQYRRHGLWNGSDFNAKKPPLAAWHIVIKPKSEGGLGVLNLRTHNDARRLKFLHEFYNQIDLPYVQLIWQTYYNNGKLPGM